MQGTPLPQGGLRVAAEDCQPPVGKLQRQHGAARLSSLSPVTVVRVSFELGRFRGARGDSRGSGLLTHEGLATRAMTITLVLC